MTVSIIKKVSLSRIKIKMSMLFLEIMKFLFNLLKLKIEII